jgi:hypothetical protein
VDLDGHANHITTESGWGTTRKRKVFDETWGFVVPRGKVRCESRRERPFQSRAYQTPLKTLLKPYQTPIKTRLNPLVDPIENLSKADFSTPGLSPGEPD